MSEIFQIAPAGKQPFLLMAPIALVVFAVFLMVAYIAASAGRGPIVHVRSDMKSNESDTVKAFIDAINHGDLVRLSHLMAEDHMFIDSGGAISHGLEKVIKGWHEYLRMFPDY
jgi:hypothetical protein